MRATFRRLLLWSGLALGLAAVVAWLVWPRPVPVDLVEVSRGRLVETVDEEGETRVRDVFVLSTPLAGRVQRIEIRAGDGVVAGETVVAEVERAEKLKLPLHHLGAVVVFGNVMTSPHLLARCADDGRAFVWMTEHGRFRARMEGPRSGNVLLRRAQHRALDSADAVLALARASVAGKVQNSRLYLLRAARDAQELSATSLRTVTRDFFSIGWWASSTSSTSSRRVNLRRWELDWSAATCLKLPISSAAFSRLRSRMRVAWRDPAGRVEQLDCCSQVGETHDSLIYLDAQPLADAWRPYVFWTEEAH